jgi:hypothetical protein
MLKMETKTEDLEGKTIKAVGEDAPHIIIVFTDDSFVWLTAKNGYDGHDGEIIIQDGPGCVLPEIGGLAVEIGIVTKAELEAFDANRLRSRAEQEARRERQLYESLKAKFEKTQ